MCMLLTMTLEFLERDNLVFIKYDSFNPHHLIFGKPTKRQPNRQPPKPTTL